MAKLKLDKNDIIVGCATVGDLDNAIEIEVGVIPSDLCSGYYKLTDNKIVLDSELKAKIELENIKATQSNEPEDVKKLKEQLEQSDYMIVKCYEYQLVGKESPYNIEALHRDRQAMRDKINLLER